jgi:hypothetical protein
MQKKENLEESSKMQVESMKQYIQDLENKLKKSEKEVEKERQKRIQAEAIVTQLRKEIKMLKSKPTEDIEAPSFDLKITQEIKKMEEEKKQQHQEKPSEETGKSPAVNKRTEKKPSSLVLRVKKRQRRNRIDPDCQYEIVHRKTKQNVDNEDQKEKPETKEGQEKYTSEQKQEEQNKEFEDEEESDTKTDEQLTTIENEETIDVDIDGYSPSTKAYKSRDITKSGILKLLNEEQQNKILTFFKFNENEK